MFILFFVMFFLELFLVDGVMICVVCVGYKDWGWCDLIFVELVFGIVVVGVMM